MKTWLACLAVAWFGGAWAPLGALEPVTMRSQSGQFIVHGLPVGQPLFRGGSSGSSTSVVDYLRLDPTLIAISFERIKHALLGELALRDQWRGKVYISVHPLREAGEDVVVTSVQHKDGWSYRIAMPELLDRDRFIRAAVQVLLQEIANRPARKRPAELPPWLATGCAAHLQAARLSTLAVEPETVIARRERSPDPLRHAREALRDRAPLMLNALNMPTDEQWSGREVALYRNCAHLLVAQLLRLRRGPECLREMVLHSADYLNWQTGFLEAFQDYFPRLIDADKWWSLNVIHLAGRDLASVWPHDTTWNQLDDILATPLEVRLEARAMPMTTQVTLQTLLSEWDYPSQAPVMERKISQLHHLSLRAAPSLVGLVKDYHACLESYVQKRDTIKAKPGTRRPAPASFKSVVRETIQRLHALDARRESSRQAPEETAAGP